MTNLEAINLAIGGIMISPVVVLVVQVLKWVNFLKDGNQSRIGVVIAALILNGLWLSTQITAGMNYAAMVDLCFTAFVSMLFAVVEYWAAEKVTEKASQRLDGRPGRG